MAKANSFMAAMRALFTGRKDFNLTNETFTDYGFTNARWLKWRNATDAADVNGIRLNSSNTLDISAAPQLLDTNGNEVVKTATTASAVNEVTVTNAATGNAPSIAATGDDTNIGLIVKGKGTGALTLGQATAAGVDLAADQPIRDSSSNELIKFSKAASAVNEITVANAATGNGPSISATGETNVPITLAGKGTGAVILGQATSTDVRLAADQPIGDSSGNEFIKFSKAATAVNEFTVANAATGNDPTLSVTGGDTDIGMTLTPKGTGDILLNGPVTMATAKVLALSAAGFTMSAIARTATADGLTTGTIASGPMLQFITVTSSDANHIVVLPAPTPGTIVVLHVAATGYELRTSDPATIGINGGTGAGAESAIGANTTVLMICASATSWKGLQLGSDGTLAKVEVAA